MSDEAKAKAARAAKIKMGQERQKVLDDLGPGAGKVRRIVGQVMQQDPDTRKRIVDTIAKLEKI